MIKCKLQLTDADDDDGIWNIKILNLNIKQICFFLKNIILQCQITIEKNECCRME